MDAASGTNGSRIAVSPALAETTARLLTTHRDDVSRHRDATFLTEARAAAAERQVEELVAKMEVETGRADAAEARGRQLEAQVAEQRAGAHWSVDVVLKQNIETIEMETGRADAAEARGRQLEAQVAEQQAGAHWSVEMMKQNTEEIEMEKGRADAAEARGRELEAAVYDYVQRQH